jgi:hypothetical protein
MASDGLDVFNFKSISSLQLLITVVTEHTQCNASQVCGYCDHDICANSSVLQCRCFLCGEYASHRKVEAAVEVFIYTVAVAGGQSGPKSSRSSTAKEDPPMIGDCWL